MKYAPAVVGLVASFAVIPGIVLAASQRSDAVPMCRTVAQATRHPIGAAAVGAGVGAMFAHGLYELIDEWSTR